jgi:hypothetical protein
MACRRRAEVTGLVFPPLNVRAVTLPKHAGVCDVLPVVTSVVTSKNSFRSTSNSVFHLDFVITGGAQWRRIS